MNDYQKFIATSRYARWIPEQQRRETWDETVSRYINFFIERTSSKFADGTGSVDSDTDTSLDSWGVIRDAIINLDVMPSMRCLMTAGPALERDHVAGYNCSFLGIDNVLAFDELMYILLCGTGVGFSVERSFIDQLQTVGTKGAAEADKTQLLIELLDQFDPELLPVVSAGHNYALRKHYQQAKYFKGVPEEDISVLENNTIIVKDSKYGWASALRILIIELFNGNFSVEWDVSLVRPAGSRLSTFGGRASGPEPLVTLFEFTKAVFKKADGRKLTSLECHDLVCKIADIVVVGGVRRSALISLSNLTDERMRMAKHGAWWLENPQRQLANNSACYTEKPDMHIFMKEWSSLYDSKSGERGLFNREAAKTIASRSGRRDCSYDFGTNPCSEIILRSKQFCNLSEVVVRSDDTLETLKRKVRIATILGTLQATLTDFVYLSDNWRDNTKEEALLGVSLTGIMDHPVLSGRIPPYEVKAFHDGEQGRDWRRANEGQIHTLGTVLEYLRGVAVETNREWAEKLGINPSAAITCVKPSGTVSQLVDSASGIHTRHSPYYLRTVRQDNKDPLTRFLIDQGVYHEPAQGKEGDTTVFYFPMKAPEGSLFRNDLTAVQHLELWKVYQDYWCEHKPSITISVKEDEWMRVGAWVYDNFDILSGVSFLPYDGGTYAQAPYQEITEQEYNDWVEKYGVTINWDDFVGYEQDDNTVGQQTLACTGTSCEL